MAMRILAQSAAASRPAGYGAAAARLLIGACIAWYLIANVWRAIPAIPKSPSDFSVYYRAGQAVRHGTSPFLRTEYDYPPLIAFLAAPLTLMDYVAARWIWFLLSQACLLLAACWMWRALGRDRIAACSAAAVWALGGAIAENLALGEAGPLLVLVFAAAYTREGTRQGAYIGFGAALKFIPGVLAAALPLRRDWRAIGGLAAGILGFLVLPWLVLQYGFSGPPAPRTTGYWMGTPAILSWSLPSAVLRAMEPPRRGDRLPADWEYGNAPTEIVRPERGAVSVAVAVCTLGAGLLALFWISRGKLNAEQSPFAVAGLLSLSLAASPICWTHYQVMQYPGLALLLCGAWRRRAWARLSGTVALGACLYQLPVGILTEYYRRHGGWTAASPPTLYFWTTVTPVASLALFVLFLWEVRLRALTGAHGTLTPSGDGGLTSR